MKHVAPEIGNAAKLQMKEETILREPKKEEVQDVVSLIRETIRDCYVGIYPPRAVEFFLNYHSNSSIEQRTSIGLVLIVEKNGEIVATGSLVGNEISGVFVRSDLQHQGIGNLLMNELEARAITAGYGKVTLSISLPSLHFYEKRGYKVVKTGQIDVGMGEYLKYWEGRKPL